MTEKTFERGSLEYNKLEIAAGVLTALDNSGNVYKVKDCYFDYGQDWMWTTILKINPNETGILRSCQFINSKEWNQIIECNDKLELLDVMKEIVESKEI